MDNLEVEPVEQTEPKPDYPLYSVGSIMLATFLGSPLAGGIVMAVNYRRLGRRPAARRAVVWSVIGTAALLAIIFELPDDLDIPNAVFYIPQLFVMSYLARSLQGAVITEHKERGGGMASAWGAAGVGVLCLVLVLGVIFVVVSIGSPELGTRLLVNKRDEVYYSGDAAEADARALGRVLTEIGFLEGRGISVLLSKSDERFTISFVVIPAAWRDPTFVQEFQNIGEALASGRFGPSLVINLCDDSLNVRKALTIRR